MLIVNFLQQKKKTLAFVFFNQYNGIDHLEKRRKQGELHGKETSFQ